MKNLHTFSAAELSTMLQIAQRYNFTELTAQLENEITNRMKVTA